MLVCQHMCVMNRYNLNILLSLKYCFCGDQICSVLIHRYTLLSCCSGWVMHPSRSALPARSIFCHPCVQRSYINLCVCCYISIPSKQQMPSSTAYLIRITPRSFNQKNIAPMVMDWQDYISSFPLFFSDSINAALA